VGERIRASAAGGLLARMRSPTLGGA